MSDLPKSVHIHEEGPREGFQIERWPISTARKIELIDSLSKTGLKHIQTVSFMPAKNVPGMADADEVVKGFTRFPGVTYTGLWLNEKGLQRAVATGKLDVKGMLLLCASEKFLLRNQKRTLKENMEAQHAIIRMYQEYQVPVERCGLMAVFGCEFGLEIE